MTGPDIRATIMADEQIIKDFMDQGIFILNPEMTRAINEITTLQFECNHSFIDGICEFCFLDKEDLIKIDPDSDTE